MFRIAILSFLTLFSLSVSSQKHMELSAMEVAEQMGVGWNLGNTLEAGNKNDIFTNNSGLSAETSWQSTKTTQEIIDYVKSQGFSSIRIPVAWVMGHISNLANNEIDHQWMMRVREIVDYCINANLYVIINQHWDGGWLENNIKDSNADSKKRNARILTDIWTQIATAFRDYDERLLFAGFNEPNAETQEQTDNLMEYAQVFVDAVRTTGGNNQHRVLIVQGSTTNIGHTHKFYNHMPKDVVADRLMMEVHYYDPWQFWGMEKDEEWGRAFYYWGAGNHVEGSSHNPTWDCEEQYMAQQLDMMKQKFADNGIPVILGEFGALWRNISDMEGESQDKHNASIRHHYYTFTKLALQAKGLVPMVWDTNYLHPSMTIIDRNNLRIYNPYMMDGIKDALRDAGR